MKYDIDDLVKIRPGGETDITAPTLIRPGDVGTVAKAVNGWYTVKFLTHKGIRLQTIRERYLVAPPRKRDTVSQLRKRIFEALYE